MSNLKFSILIPTYNGAYIIKDTIKSILSQSFQNFEILIHDDASEDNIEEVVKSFKNKRIIFYKNKKNLGCQMNMEEGRKKAKGEIFYLMAQDDILGSDALLNTYKAFQMSNDIGVVTRPYFWTYEDINTPVRAKAQLNPNKDEIVTISDSFDRISIFVSTLDQISGLACRTKFIDTSFHTDIFPGHIYPFLAIFKKHPAVFLKDYNVAVRVQTSQSRVFSSIYDKSPLKSWVRMFKTVLSEKKYKPLRNKLISEFVAINYVGLVQIRNYSKYKYLVREVLLLLKYRPRNIINLHFWFYSLLCLILPPIILRKITDYYKKKVYSNQFKNIKFSYQL